MHDERQGEIILVRHGETEANRRQCFADSDEIPLTKTGRSQAHALALRLSRDFRPQRLLSSEFFRARETSAILARTLGLEAEVIPGIHERDFGCLKGQPYERMGDMMSTDASYDAGKFWLWRPASGESLDEVRQRAIAALDALRVRCPDQRVVVVCHGAVIQSVCAHISGGWSDAYTPANCGIVVVRHDAGGWKRLLT